MDELVDVRESSFPWVTTRRYGKETVILTLSPEMTKEITLGGKRTSEHYSDRTLQQRFLSRDLIKQHTFQSINLNYLQD